MRWSDSGDYSGLTFLSLRLYHFTPLHAVIGGLLLGVAVLSRMALKGEVLGISGIAKGLVQGSFGELKRWVFLLGLIAGGFGLNLWYPSAFGTVQIPIERAIIAGLAVGLGSSIGNGCTSGHGICGNARFSRRSMAFTAVFMLVGFITATLLQSRDVVQTFSRHSSLGVAATCRLAALALAAHALGYILCAKVLPENISSFLSELIDGSLFAAGLGISGMTNPTRVAEFLDIHGKAWNPTLMFVMVGAIGLGAPFSQGGRLAQYMKQPFLASQFKKTSLTNVDLPLLVGAVLFGLGWGVAGMCPGPAICNLGNPNTLPLPFLAAMFGGFFLAPYVAKVFSNQKVQ